MSNKGKFWKPGHDKPNPKMPDELTIVQSKADVGLSESTMKMKFMQRKKSGGAPMDTSRVRMAPCSGAPYVKHGNGHVPSSSSPSMLSAVSSSVFNFEGSNGGEEMDEATLLPGRRSFGGFNAVVERQYVARCGELGYKNVAIGPRKKDRVREEKMKDYAAENQQHDYVQDGAVGSGVQNPWGDEDDDMLQLRPDKPSSRKFSAGAERADSGIGKGRGKGKKKGKGKGKGGDKRTLGDGGLSSAHTEASRAKRRKV